MSKKKMIVRQAVMTVDGTLDLDAALTTHCNSIVKSIDNSVAVTLAFTAGSSYDNGQLDESNYPALVFYFKTATTTVSDFEAAVTASKHMVVVTPGTAGNTLVAGLVGASGDEFAASALASGTMSANADACIVECGDMTNVSVFLNQITDSGTVTIVLDKSVDGTNFAIVDASTTAGDFVAGNNTSLEFPLSDANGMPTLAKQVRATVTAYGASGIYTMTVAGLIDA